MDIREAVNTIANYLLDPGAPAPSDAHLLTLLRDWTEQCMKMSNMNAEIEYWRRLALLNGTVEDVEFSTVLFLQ